METERKWLFDTEIVPDDVRLMQTIQYGQAYLSVKPEFRIRWKKVDFETTYKLCIKGKGKLARPEIEKDLTEDEFKMLMIVGKLSMEDFIEKHIRVYDVGGYEFHIGLTDVHRDTRFIYGEIEYGSKEEANAFVAPDWFGKEVTKDDYYKMKNYWTRTRLMNNKSTMNLTEAIEIIEANLCREICKGSCSVCEEAKHTLKRYAEWEKLGLLKIVEDQTQSELPCNKCGIICYFEGIEKQCPAVKLYAQEKLTNEIINGLKGGK